MMVNKKLSPQEVAELLVKSKEHNFRKHSQAQIDRNSLFTVTSSLQAQKRKKEMGYQYEVLSPDKKYHKFKTTGDVSKKFQILKSASPYSGVYFPKDGAWYIHRDEKHNPSGYYCRRLIKGIPRPVLPRPKSRSANSQAHKVQVKPLGKTWKTFDSATQAGKYYDFKTICANTRKWFPVDGSIQTITAPRSQFKGWQTRRVVDE